MKLVATPPSANFSEEIIPVEFVVLHYTACDLQRALEIFSDRERKVCAHFVLDMDGACYDLGGFFTGPIRKGAHAGESRLTIDGKDYSSFNTMSIGIEIVNLNGNVLSYTEAQYASLTGLLRHLQTRFPILKESSRIIGHEHIAGHRGKCDPGHCFDWARLFTSLDLAGRPFHETRIASAEDLLFVREAVANAPQRDSDWWSRLSAGLEERIRTRKQQG